MKVRKLRIASIAMQAKDGAGLSSHKLHKEFLRAGHESRMLVAKQSWNQDQVELLPTQKKYKQNWWSLGTVPLNHRAQNIVSSGLSGKCPTALDKVHQWSDVVLLRWITSTVSDFQIGRWSHQRKPLVWCLSDMAPITGGCHYSNGCRQYESDCAKCPLVAKGFEEIPKRVLERRRTLWRDVTVVSPSKWLATCVSNSAALRGKRVEVIQTGVELDVFYPENASEAKSKFVLDQQRTTLLFGANSLDEERKGFDLLIVALRKLFSSQQIRDSYQLLIVGKGASSNSELESLGVPVAYTGHLQDRPSLRSAYSAADIVVLPYREDNLPNVMLEAIACGVPVVAFAVGGMIDVIRDGVNGALAIPFDATHMAHTIGRVRAMHIERQEIRAWAESHIDIREQGRRYIELFLDLTHREPTLELAPTRDS